jgi:hypothetical protein
MRGEPCIAFRIDQHLINFHIFKHGINLHPFIRNFFFHQGICINSPKHIVDRVLKNYMIFDRDFSRNKVSLFQVNGKPSLISGQPDFILVIKNAEQPVEFMFVAEFIVAVLRPDVK